MVFKKWTGKTALLTLKIFPTPAKVLEAGADKILTVWRTVVKRSVGIKKAQALVKAATNSIGRTNGYVASEASLQNLLVEYELYSAQLEQLEQLMWELLLKVPNATKLLDIKGIGLVTAATFISETGDIHRFDHPRQIQKLAGCNLVENSSGKHKGKSTISRRGRKRLRHGLFMAMIAILGKNQEFRELHHRNLTRERTR